MNQLEGLGMLMQDWIKERECNADFFSKENQTYFTHVLQTYRCDPHKPLVFLPCASTKPISKSRTHCYLSPLTRDDRFEKVIISEPQSVIPYSMEDLCPNYDFPPKDLTVKDREVYIRRIGIFLAKLAEIRSSRILWYIGGQHHLDILREAVEIEKHFIVIGTVPPKGIRDYHRSAKNLADEILSVIGRLQ